VKRYYYTDQFKTDGRVLGPVTIEKLKQLYYWKEITEKCLVCIEGTEDWQSCLEVLKLKKQLPDKAFDIWAAVKAPLVIIGLWAIAIGVDYFLKASQADLISMDIEVFSLPIRAINIIFLVVLFFMLTKIFWYWFIQTPVGKACVFSIFIFILGYCAFVIFNGLRAVPTFVKDAKFIKEGSVNSTAGSSSSSYLTGKNIIGVEKVTTESRVKPSIGVIRGGRGKKPRTGIVGTYERGSTKYKVTYEDDDGIIRTETLNKDPTKD